MRHPLLSFLTTMPSSSSSSTTTTKHQRKHSSSTTTTTTNHHSSTFTATLDLLILILVLFSCTFLLTSYFSYIFNSLSLLLLHHHHHHLLPVLAAFLLSFAAVFAACAGGFRLRSRRKCHNPKCKGLKKALEFDLQLQSEECLKSGANEVDKLPWKGGSETNPDYECLRAELRKMAPVNGRAVLLFRAKCGCPLAKLVGWGPKKGRKHKKSLANVAANGDHR